MPTGTRDGRRRLYLDFDGYFAAVEEQTSPARRAVHMRMPRRYSVLGGGVGGTTAGELLAQAAA